MLVLPILMGARTASADPSVEGPVGRALHALATERAPKVRTQAVLALRDDADEPRVRDALIDALTDDSPLVRAAAANVLGTLAGPHGFESLCVAATDADPLVARWAGWAVRRTLAMAPRVKVRVKGLRSPGRDKSDELAKTYQDGVLKALLADTRFDVASSMDFDDEVPEGDRVAFFGLSLPGVKVPVVTVSLVGRVVTDGDRRAAVASASLRAEVPGGFAAFEVAAEARGVEGPPPPPDPFADEFSIPKERDDARVVAAEAAGRAVGVLLIEAFEPEAVPPAEVSGGRAERNHRRGR
jgi:hypothetical protein